MSQKKSKFASVLNLQIKPFMKPLHRILSSLLIGILLLSCENEQQTWLSEMEGILDCTVPDVIGKGLPVEITAAGITTPGNVAYTWSAPEFSPRTFTGATFEAIAPTIAGEYNIFITAHSAGYRDVTKKKKIIVLECAPMQGNLDIGAPAEVIKGETVQFTARGITSPTEENMTYEWNAPNFGPDSYTGSVFEPQAPLIPGRYRVTVTAKADNYCSESLDTTIVVKEGRKMQGMFDFTVPPPPVIIGQKVTFAARGITTPSATDITYEWFASGFTAGTTSGNSYTAFSTSTGAHTVTVTAKARLNLGYSDTTVSRQITVEGEQAIRGSISIALPSEVIVSQPVTFHVSDGITDPPLPHDGIFSYVWDAPFFTPSTYQSADNTFTATAPPIAGNYNITVTAKAPLYNGAATSTMVTVKKGMDIPMPPGTLFDFEMSDPIVKDLGATFTVTSNLSTTNGAPITYKWEALDFTPGTFSGSTFTCIPNIAGTHTITLYATADSYTPLSKPKPVVVSTGLDMGTLSIVAQGGNLEHSFNAGIDDVTFTPDLSGPPPISPITYTWSAPQCIPQTSTGNEFTPKLPSNAGNYTITLKAEATGYHPKTATFDYTISCSQMPVSFNLSRSELLTNEETILTVNPSVSNASYTWDIPTDFTITAGSTITHSVTIKTPDSEKVGPVPLTLKAEAVNFCPNSHSETVTVKSCYPLPSSLAPTITSNATEDNNGWIHATNLQTVRFFTVPIQPRRSGGTTTYSWDFGAPLNGGYSFTPSSSPVAINNITFETKAPLQDPDRIYTLTLQIAADGYCTISPVLKNVIVDKSNGQLTGTVKIMEAVAPKSDPNNPVVWIANGRPVTLRAQYQTEIPEERDNLEYSWYWVDENNGHVPLSSSLSNKGILTFTPAKAGMDFLIGVSVRDLNGKQGIGKEYPYTVQNCGKSDLPSLRIDVNYPCGFINNTYATAYVIDSIGGNYTYQAVSIGNKWWLTENLRKGTTNAKTSHINIYGAYYPATAISDMGNPDGVYCPKGWRIPNQTEWNTLNNTASSTNNGEEVFQKLAIAEAESNPGQGSSKAWNSTQVTNTVGLLDSYGLSLIPAGFYQNNTLYNNGMKAEFFMSTGGIQGYGLQYNGPAQGTAYQVATQTERYHTVRCVND